MALNPQYIIFETLQNVASYDVHLNSIIKNRGHRTRSVNHLKLNLRVFLTGYTAVMVTYFITKSVTTCSPMIGQFFDTMTVASIDQQWLKWLIEI